MRKTTMWKFPIFLVMESHHVHIPPDQPRTFNAHLLIPNRGRKNNKKKKTKWKQITDNAGNGICRATINKRIRQNSCLDNSGAVPGSLFPIHFTTNEFITFIYFLQKSLVSNSFFFLLGTKSLEWEINVFHKIVTFQGTQWLNNH